MITSTQIVTSIHPNISSLDQERLLHLEQSGVFDTPNEQEFEDLTQLAIAIFGTPISFFSLIDQNQQWFKSKNEGNPEEIPMHKAFCAEALRSGNMFIVEDTTKHPKFHNHPMVTGAPFIRFYAGVPVISETGSPLGTFCVIDTHPRWMDNPEREALAALARQCGRLMDLKLKTGELNLSLIHKQKIARRLNALLIQQENMLNDFQEMLHIGRTRITPCLASAHEILNQLEETPPEEVVEHGQLAQLHSNIRQASFTLENLLEINSYRLRPLSPEHLDMHKLALAAADEIREWPEAKNVNITVGSLPCIMGNQELIRLMIFELLANAVRHNHETETCEVSIQEIPNMVFGFSTIEVRDSGRGFPSTETRNIFKAFTKLEGAAEAGYGLGLSRAQKIIQLHGGGITASSIPGNGTVITVILPLVPLRED